MLKDWEAATQHMDAMRLGRAETEAAKNLLSSVPPAIVERLAGYVRTSPQVASGLATNVFFVWQELCDAQVPES